MPGGVHSFPTRRSSDLEERRVGKECILNSFSISGCKKMINELSDGEVAEGIYTLSQAIRLCLAGEHNCVQRRAVCYVAGRESSFYFNDLN